jgi:hypothetical protein
MTPETENEELVSMKISKSTHDFLKKAKDQLGVGSIDAVIHRLHEVANQSCYIDSDIDFIPCDVYESGNIAPFNFRKCPPFCPRYNNVKRSHWWKDIVDTPCGGFTKEDYVNYYLEYHESQYSREAYEKGIKECEEEHQADPTYKVGNWDYDWDHKPFKPTPPPTREILEARFKEHVENDKEEVLKMEKLRKQPLFQEWAKIWNYPACIEGIKTIKDPFKDD